MGSEQSKSHDYSSNNIHNFKSHVQLCKTYLDSLSDHQQRLVKDYTFESYNTLRNYLVSKINMCMFDNFDNTITDFTTKTTDDCLDLYSILINAPKIDVNIKLYHFFSETSKGKFIKVNSLNSEEPLKLKYKHTMDVNEKYLEPKFISTTYDPEVVKYLSGFSNYSRSSSSQSCCHIEFIIPKGFPLLFIPQEYSYYPYQKEVLIPYGLLFKVTQTKLKTLSLYSPTDMEELINNKVRSIRIKENATLEEKTFNTQEVLLDVKLISKKNIEFINNKLRDYYYIYYPNEHDYRHIARVIITSLLLVKIYEEITRQKYSNIIYGVMFVGLFHDSGRKGRDGEDIWEEESAKITTKELSMLNISDEYIENISKAIHDPEDDNLLHMIFKGADSLDIIRVISYYKKELNPFYNFIKKQKPSLISTIDSLFSKLEMEQQILIDVMRYIQDTYKYTYKSEGEIKTLINLHKSGQSINDVEDSVFDVCDREYEEPEDRDELYEETLEEHIFEDGENLNMNEKKINRSIQAKRRLTMKRNNEYIYDVAKYASRKRFFSDERKDYIFSDSIVLIRLLSDVLPVYKQYLSGFVFQV